MPPTFTQAWYDQSVTLQQRALLACAFRSFTTYIRELRLFPFVHRIRDTMGLCDSRVFDADGDGSGKWKESKSKIKKRGIIRTRVNLIRPRAIVFVWRERREATLLCNVNKNLHIYWGTLLFDRFYLIDVNIFDVNGSDTNSVNVWKKFHVHFVRKSIKLIYKFIRKARPYSRPWYFIETSLVGSGLFGLNNYYVYLSKYNCVAKTIKYNKIKFIHTNFYLGIFEEVKVTFEGLQRSTNILQPTYIHILGSFENFISKLPTFD